MRARRIGAKVSDRYGDLVVSMRYISRRVHTSIPNNTTGRTCDYIAAAKAKGKKLGNPRKHFDKKRATELRKAGWGQIRIAKELGVGVGTINKWLHRV